MNSMKKISQEEYLARKAEAMRCEPIARMIQLGSISLEPNSMADGFVRIEGKSVSADNEFFKWLSKLLNISGRMRSDLAGSGKDSKLDSEGMFASMAEAMKMLKNTKNGGMNVTIIGDPTTNRLTGITDKKYSRVPNSNLFDIADSIMQRHPDILPVEVHVSGGGMGLNLSFVNNIDIGFGKSDGPDGGIEAFNFGFTLNNGLVKDDNDAINAHNRQEIARTFFRGLGAVRAKLAARNIDPADLTKKQKQYIITPQTMWDAINSLTWLGSHDTSYKWKSQRGLQAQAGEAFAKEYDLANLDLLQM